jgi:hypothetical protein
MRDVEVDLSSNFDGDREDRVEAKENTSEVLNYVFTRFHTFAAVELCGIVGLKRLLQGEVLPSSSRTAPSVHETAHRHCSPRK